MRRAAYSLVAAITLTGLGMVPAANAEPAGTAPAASASAAQPARSARGVAIVAIGSARDHAFDLARAIYGSRLRPPSLDEVRARALAGDPPPPNASRELRELSEIRGSLNPDDASGRRLLTGLAQQVGAEALLVVKLEAPAASPPADPDAGDAGDPDAASDAGAGNAAAPPTVVARLFLAAPGDYDAARYAPEPGLQGSAAWKATVTSLEARFPAIPETSPGPAGATKPVTFRPEEQKSTPFYTSGWFWGALGGAALLAGAFYLASRDTSEDPIHLQMRAPR